MRLRKALQQDVPTLLALINGYAARGQLLARSEDSLRARLEDFTVIEADGELVGCGALSELGPGLGEVRSLAVREDLVGRGFGRRIVARLLEEAGERGFGEVLALTRSVPFFEALGFSVTRRERFLDKLRVDCLACPMNLCCDEVAMVREPTRRSQDVPDASPEPAAGPRSFELPSSLRGGGIGTPANGLRPFELPSPLRGGGIGRGGR